MVKKQVGKDYSKIDDLNEKSVEKYSGTLKRLEKHGITLTQAKKMTNDELRVALDSKATDNSLKALRRVFEQMSFDSDRRNLGVEKVMSERTFDTPEAKAEARKELIKTSGNVFAEVVNKLQENYEYKDQKEAEKHAKELLGVDYESEAYDILDDIEKEVYIEYGTP